MSIPSLRIAASEDVPPGEVWFVEHLKPLVQITGAQITVPGQYRIVGRITNLACPAVQETEK